MTVKVYQALVMIDNVQGKLYDYRTIEPVLTRRVKCLGSAHYDPIITAVPRGSILDLPILGLAMLKVPRADGRYQNIPADELAARVDAKRAAIANRETMMMPGAN